MATEIWVTELVTQEGQSLAATSMECVVKTTKICSAFLHIYLTFANSIFKNC